MTIKNRSYGKVFNLCTSEKKTNVVVSYLVKIGYTGTFNTVYNEGDRFNPEGLIILAYFFNEEPKELPYSTSALWKYYPDGPLTEKDNFITVKYSQDGKTATVKIPITVNKQYIKRPKIKSDLIYDGSVQSPEIIDFDENYVKLSGQLEGILAGDYIINARVINDKYSFYPEPDSENTGEKEIQLKWSIKKAPRPFRLSTSEVYYDESNQFEEYTVYLNYPGYTQYSWRKIENEWEGTAGFDVRFLQANKTVKIIPRNEVTGYHKQVYELYIPADEQSGYEESEKLKLIIIRNIWDWGNENYIPTSHADTLGWVRGLGRRILAGKQDTNWIGKKKYFYGKGALGVNTSPTIQFTCVDLNKDADNSITFMTSFALSEPVVFNKPDTNTWPDQGTFDPPTILDNAQNSILNVPNKDSDWTGQYIIIIPKEGTFREYIKPLNKKYWTGESLKTSTQEFWIPSLAELGVVNISEAPNYIGGIESEYSDNVNKPYSFFVSGGNSRIKTPTNSTNRITYWTRSTVDNEEFAEGTHINRNQYAINENGAPVIKNKTDQAYFVFGFTLSFDKEKEASLYGESI